MRECLSGRVAAGLGFVMLVLANLVSPNAAFATDDDQSIYAGDLLELSGMRQQLALIPDAIASGFDELGKELSAHQKKRFEEQVALAFAPDRLEKVMLETLISELSEEAFIDAIKWYQTALGRKISELEVLNSNLSSQTQRDRFFQSLAQQPPDSDRVLAMTELDLAWKATDASVSLMLDMQVAVSAALMSGMSVSEQLPLSVLVESAERQREKLKRHYTSETLLSMLYVYAALTLDEIDDYRYFAKTKHGEQFVDAINLALHKAMLEGSYTLGQGLGDLMREVNEQVM